MVGLLRDAVSRITCDGVTEVRALADQHTHSGYFSDPEALVRAVEPLDADPSVLGIYLTLNEVNPALLSRRANRIKMRLGRKDATTGDADILRRRWLPIDIDPDRPSGVSGTDEEHAQALAMAGRIAAWLASAGFPEPVMADSGNGAHLLYRIDLPNDADATGLVKACLATLDLLFSNGRVKVDTANFNAARIWKLYGTVSRKGDNTPERPHRRSRIITAPDEQEVVRPELLRELAARLPTGAGADQPAVKPENGVTKNTFDLRHWLEVHGIRIRGEKPYNGGTLYILDECPFSTAHKDGAFAIRFGNGAVFAGCKHTSCGGGTQRWQELRERYEPDRSGRHRQFEKGLAEWRKERAHARAGNDGAIPPAVPVPAQEDPPHKNHLQPALSVPLPGNLPVQPRPAQGTSPPQKVPPPGSPDFRERALVVLAREDPVAYMLAAFAQDHVGDGILARCMILSMASQAINNSDGLHVSVTGESGKGKTHAFKKMMRQVPDQFRVKGTVSNKALYYKKDLRPRTVFMSDDTELSDGIQEILKSATSNFHEPITHTTVTKDLVSRVCTIPERCVWWIAKKEGTGDDQVANRMLTCWIDESAEQDARVLEAKQKKECREPGMLADETEELLVSREIWEILHEQTLWVVIPFSERIRFNTITNRRNPDMLYDLIKSHAALFFLQRRQKTGPDGTICVYADTADFAAANEVFSLLNGTSGGQESKMTKKESDLLSVIEKAGLPEFTIPDLQRFTGRSYMGIYRLIKGYESRGKNYTGLLEKCPALSFTDRMVTMNEEDGLLVRRRTEAFTWNRELYREWMHGGSCWLDQDPKGPAGGDNDTPGAGDREDTGSFTALPHAYSSFTAPAVNRNEAPGAAGSVKEDNYHNNYVHPEGDLPQNRNYGGDNISGDGSGRDADPHLHDLRNAVNENRSLTGGAQQENPAPQTAPDIYSTCCKPAEPGPDPSPAAVNQVPSPAIRSRDYKKLDIPEPKTVCCACGKKGAGYVEKFTRERRARPKDLQDAQRICRSCYTAAVTAEQDTGVPLPGTIDPGRMERVTAEVGICPVCGVEPAVYIDRRTGGKLCGHCYGREVRRGN